ncbi:MAG: ATP-binding cassette domain-containing protein [Clostridia bacterium]
MLLNNVTCGYSKDIMPIQNFSVTLAERGVIAILGNSGCGKSTLLKAIAGFLPITCGEIVGRDRLRFSMVFQENRLINALSAYKNIALVTNESERIALSLKIVELSDKANISTISDLSGGMQRRVAIARAIAYSGDVLLLDEAFTGLDTDLLKRIAKRLGDNFPLVIAVTHNIEEAKAIGNIAQIIEL